MVFGDRFTNALTYAVQVHGAQNRKGTEIPYIGHLLGVCSLVIEEDGDETEAIAALLHDAPEDQGGDRTLEEIRERFGNQVAAIVLACTDTLETPKPPWRARKEAYIAHLDDVSRSALLVSLADKLFNARAILRDYRRHGEGLWQRFNQGREDQLWYYRCLADAFTRLLPDPPMAGELAEVVAELEHLVAQQA
jgi:(p)ppGpp synthase/HD superfamily hydrolase